MKWLKAVGGLVALAAAILVVARFAGRIDLTELRRLRGLLVAESAAGVLLFQLLIVTLHSLQWGLLLKVSGIEVKALRIMGARLAGAAVSILSPALSLGGELVRAALVTSPSIDFRELSATVAVDKYIELATRFPFILAGLAILVAKLRGESWPLVAAAVGFALVVVTASLVLFSVSRRRGGAARLARALSRPFERSRPGIARRIRRSTMVFASGLTAMWPSRLLPIALIGASAAAVELFQILFLLHVFGFATVGAAAVVLATSVLGGVFSFVPANIGGMEAASVVAFSLIGAPAGAGIPYALLLRAGQFGLVLIGIGYMIVRRDFGFEALRPRRQFCTDCRSSERTPLPTRQPAAESRTPPQRIRAGTPSCGTTLRGTDRRR